jgi:hypothetical protein
MRTAWIAVLLFAAVALPNTAITTAQVVPACEFTAPAGRGPAPSFKDLEQWVEQDKAPEQIIASHSRNGTVDRTRPLCPYPQMARYKRSREHR